MIIIGPPKETELWTSKAIYLTLGSKSNLAYINIRQHVNRKYKGNLSTQFLVSVENIMQSNILLVKKRGITKNTIETTSDDGLCFVWTEKTSRGILRFLIWLLQPLYHILCVVPSKVADSLIQNGDAFWIIINGNSHELIAVWIWVWKVINRRAIIFVTTQWHTEGYKARGMHSALVIKQSQRAPGCCMSRFGQRWFHCKHWGSSAQRWKETENGFGAKDSISLSRNERLR